MVAVNLTTPGSVFSFNDPTALTVGTVVSAMNSNAGSDPLALFGPLSGVTTNNGDINLQSGRLAVDQAGTAGTGIVRLVESGALSQATTGPIAANSLSVTDRT